MKHDDRIFAVVGGCVVLAVALAAVVMWLGTGINVDAPQRATVVVKELPVPTPATSFGRASQVIEADLSQVDEEGPVRDAVAALSSHPQLAAYLIHDRLLRRFVGAVDAIAGGYSPRDEVEFMRPSRPFLVREDEGRLVVAAGSYRRYDAAAEVFASIDTDGAVELYERLGPRLEAIYREVGWASEDFDSRLREAVDHLLEVEAPSVQVEVEQRAIVYAYAEDRFERLSGAQKQLLRMGPGNVRRVLAKLRDLRSNMGWPERAPTDVTAQLDDVPATQPDSIAKIAGASPMVPVDSTIDRVGAAEAP